MFDFFKLNLKFYDFLFNIKHPFFMFKSVSLSIQFYFLKVEAFVVIGFLKFYKFVFKCGYVFRHKVKSFFLMDNNYYKGL